MTRMIGPDAGYQLVYRLSGDALTTAANVTAVIYSDQACTVPADILDLGGAPIPASRITVGTDSQLPLFQFPDGVRVLYTSVGGGPAVALYARSADLSDEAITAAATDATTKANAARDSAIAAAVPLSLVNAKGDLIVGAADNAVTRLPVGADRRVPAADSSQAAGIRWTDPLGLEYVTTSIQGSLGTGSNAWPVANDARYARVLGSGAIGKIGLEVTVQSGNICVAVYSKTGSGINAQPGARVATSGAIACPPVGYVEISLGGSISVSDGDYLALSCDNITAAFRGVSGSANRLAAVISAAQSVAHPLPPTATPVASASRIPLLIGIP